MVVDPYARSAEASRIVQERLPICTAIVTQFVTHFGATSAPRPSLAGDRAFIDPDWALTPAVMLANTYG